MNYNTAEQTLGEPARFLTLDEVEFDEAGCHRCLVVADEGRPNPWLYRTLERLCEAGPCEFHVLVPRHRREVLVSDPALAPATDRNEITVSTHGTEYDVSEARLDCFMRALTALGQPLSGEVETGNVVRRVRNLTQDRPFDEVLVLSRPRRGFFTRNRDLASSIRRACRIPVTAVTVDEPAA